MNADAIDFACEETLKIHTNWKESLNRAQFRIEAMKPFAKAMVNRTSYEIALFYARCDGFHDGVVEYKEEAIKAIDALMGKGQEALYEEAVEIKRALSDKCRVRMSNSAEDSYEYRYCLGVLDGISKIHFLFIDILKGKKNAGR